MAKRLALDGDAFESRRRGDPAPWVCVFVARWCQPCERLLARLSAATTPASRAIEVGVIDVDREPLLAERYGVRGTPTLYLFVDGEVKGVRVGALSETQLATFFAELEKS